MLWTQWVALIIGHVHVAWLRNTPLPPRHFYPPSPYPPTPSPSPEPDHDHLTDAEFVAYLLTSFGLVLMAGLMSGLTLGLMSLDQVDIEVLRRSGNSKQRACAAKIYPVLQNPHRLLVTLLVCNAIAAEALPLVLDRLTSPITAVTISVTVVLLFGEIIPQAACSAYGLEIGAAAAPFVRVLMFIISPIAIPIAWSLDRILGHQRQTALFRRGELKALVDIHGEGQAFGGQLSEDEVRIIKGALDLTNKRAKSAMTPLDMVFMLSLDDVLDDSTLTAVLASGHSRIPIHRPGNRGEIVGILLVKELILINPSEGKRVSEMKVRSLPHLLAETPMYDMLKLFQLGRSHMAVLTAPTKEALAARKAAEDEVAIDIYSISEGDFSSDDAGDYDMLEENLLSPEERNIDATDGGIGQQRQQTRAFSRRHYESDNESQASNLNSGSDSEGCMAAKRIYSLNFQPHELVAVGIITIEDVLEELLGSEIVDETDTFVDNMHRQRVNVSTMTSSLPPHLRMAVERITPRVGSAGIPERMVYRMASTSATREAKGPSNDVENLSMLDTRRSSALATTDSGALAEHLPRVMRPSQSLAGSVAARTTAPQDGIGKPGFWSTRRPSGHLPDVHHPHSSTHHSQRRRTAHMTQGLQEQLDLLKPLIERQRAKRGIDVYDDMDAGGEITRAEDDQEIMPR